MIPGNIDLYSMVYKRQDIVALKYNILIVKTKMQMPTLGKRTQVKQNSNRRKANYITYSLVLVNVLPSLPQG